MTEKTSIAHYNRHIQNVSQRTSSPQNLIARKTKSDEEEKKWYILVLRTVK